jgi:hypothetical protein
MRSLAVSCALVFSAVLVAAPPTGAQEATPPAIPERPASPSHMAPTDARSTMRHVLLSQEQYRARHGRYAASVASLSLSVPAGVRVEIRIQEGGYAAVATQGMEECAAYQAPAEAPRPYVAREGAVHCRPRR